MEQARWRLAEVRSGARLVSATADHPQWLRELGRAGELACPMPGCSDRRLSFVPHHTRLGRPVTAHFRHRSTPDSDVHSGESAQHLLAKLHLKRWGDELGYETFVERAEVSVGRRPDVTMIEPDTGRRIYIEVQYATLDEATWRRRDSDLQQLEGTTIWIWGMPPAAAGARLNPAQRRCQAMTGSVWFISAEPDGIRLGEAYCSVTHHGEYWTSRLDTDIVEVDVELEPTEEIELSPEGLRSPTLETRLVASLSRSRSAMANGLHRWAAVVARAEEASRRARDQLGTFDGLLRELAATAGVPVHSQLDVRTDVLRCTIGRLGLEVSLDQLSGWWGYGHCSATYELDGREAAEPVGLLVRDDALYFAAKLFRPARQAGRQGTFEQVGSEVSLLEILTGDVSWSERISEWQPFSGHQVRSGWLRRNAGQHLNPHRSIACPTCEHLVSKSGLNDRWLPADAAVWKRSMLLGADLTDREACVRYVADEFDMDPFDVGRAVRPFYREASPHAVGCLLLQQERHHS